MAIKYEHRFIALYYLVLLYFVFASNVTLLIMGDSK